jgi:hypothetical protein
LGIDVGQKIEERWVWSFLHGDLSAMNMILSCKRKFYLVDWEMFTVGTVAWDLKKLYPSHPLEVLHLLRQLRIPGELDAEEQMFFGLSCELTALRINRENRIGYLVRHRGKSMSEAMRNVRDHEGRLIFSMRELI